jgi:hypothetical protein
MAGSRDSSQAKWADLRDSYTEGPDGKSVPWKIADEDNVDKRRREAGLSSLKENTRRILQEDELLNEEI